MKSNRYSLPIYSSQYASFLFPNIPLYAKGGFKNEEVNETNSTVGEMTTHAKLSASHHFNNNSNSSSSANSRVAVADQLASSQSLSCNRLCECLQNKLTSLQSIKTTRSMVVVEGLDGAESYNESR